MQRAQPNPHMTKIASRDVDQALMTRAHVLCNDTSYKTPTQANVTVDIHSDMTSSLRETAKQQHRKGRNSSTIIASDGAAVVFVQTFR